MATKPRRHRPSDINTAMLPPQLRMLVRVMGVGPALALVEARGGCKLTVPVRCSPEHWLNHVVGPAAFAALVSDSAGITMELPKADAATRQWRHQQVHELSRSMTNDQVAMATGYTRRHVINIRNAEAEAAGLRQGDLFADLLDLDEADLVDQVDAREEADDGRDTYPSAHNPFGLAGPQNRD